jgi:hypothetical protein
MHRGLVRRMSTAIEVVNRTTAQRRTADPALDGTGGVARPVPALSAGGEPVQVHLLGTVRVSICGPFDAWV